jgi:hypothetical protein
MSPSTISRVIKLLDQWIQVWACLSAVVIPPSPVNEDGSAPTGDAQPDLEAQLTEIFKFVVIQERRWQTERRSGRFSSRHSRKRLQT